ncbi:hypothetical protein CBW65_18590 [Tumebacillus avium]|uniref:Peptidase C39-like domain-containing protein n=1 Tax=Tumebacillus avium TaxID=1903704 RepID=A0A1Y0IQE9_9BACL|nr:hypothetical protein [Tumebacillus avium]ARU62751.1 hypothetical protein CBW65_18590 [Tumebacillus avium]
MNNMKKFMLASLFVTVTMSPVNVWASAPTHAVLKTQPQQVTSIESLIPKKMAAQLQSDALELISDAAAIGILESVSMVAAKGEESADWHQRFAEGRFQVERVVPIYNLLGELAEVMVVINDGCVITDVATGEVVQVSFSGVDKAYLEDKAALYVHGLEHFAVDEAGNVVEGNKKGQKIQTVKQKHAGKVQKVQKKVNKKWGQLAKENKERILDAFNPAGLNEGNSDSDYITDPNLWLLRYYPNNHNVLRDLSVTQLYSYSRYVPEILQSSWNTKENDCAVISSLEIMGYYWSLTSTQKTAAYNAMINSSYFEQPDDGVYPWNNDALFKAGADSIGKTQQTSDDPEDYSPSYSDIKSYLLNHGPGYLSFGYNDQPYVDHTVTVKGVKEFKTTYTDTLYIKRNFYDNFLMINDHWDYTSSDAYVRYRDDETWYYVSIVKN